MPQNQTLEREAPYSWERKRDLRENQIKNSPLTTQIKSFLHQISYCIFYVYIESIHVWVYIITTCLIRFCLTSSYLSIFTIKPSLLITCMFLDHMLNTRIENWLWWIDWVLYCDRYLGFYNLCLSKLFDMSFSAWYLGLI